MNTPTNRDMDCLTETAPNAAPSAADVLLKLAERCEREEPSWELNLAIFLAIRPEWQDTRTFRDRKGNLTGPMLIWNEATKDCRKVEEAVADVTRSLDSAVTLVPEGCGWSLYWDKSNEGQCMGRVWSNAYTPKEGCWTGHAALSLCAAALRARAALTNGAASDAERSGTPTSPAALVQS